MTKIAVVYRLRFRLFRRMLETGVRYRGAKNQRFRMLMPPSLQPPLESAQQLISIDTWIFGLEGLENLARSRCRGRIGRDRPPPLQTGRSENARSGAVWSARRRWASPRRPATRP